MRRKQQDVLFLCGSDEHGIPVTIRAKKENSTPQEVVNRYHAVIEDAFRKLNISFDIYHRTSSELHHDNAANFFMNLYEKGVFTEKVTEQYFDPEAGEFLADRYITGDCPKCGNSGAYGDQCEKCGSSLSPEELINPVSALSGSTPQLRETKNWYLPLQQYQDFLRQWILQGHKDDWKSNVLGQVKSWLDDGLQPRAMTRDLDWGVQVPLDEAAGKVLYVWFDAPIGYISASQAWSLNSGKDWKPYWQDADTHLVHFIGKDNIVFHCIIFPAMLKAHGDYILPENVPANEFLNLENDKISTSRNWAVWAHEFVDTYPQFIDTLRFVLTANMPENKDNNFTWKDFQTKNNSELVGIAGNFLNRVMVLTDKYCDGVVPAKSQDFEELADMHTTATKIGEFIEKYEFRNALNEWMNLARLGNQFLQAQEPWKKIKDQPEAVPAIVRDALEIAALLAHTAEPFMPDTSAKMLKMLNIDLRPWSELGAHELLQEGHKIGEQSLLFEKVEDEMIENEIQKLENTKADNATATAYSINVTPAKETCTYDDFQKIDLRVGTILEAKKVEKADKLLQFVVDTGLDHRTIVSGIAEHFTPEEMVGKKVTVLVNLAPRKIRGIESQGMLLFVENAEGKLVNLSPDGDVQPGNTIN